MSDLKKFGKKRLEYLKRRHPQIVKDLEEHGILEIHLLFAQKRADRQMDKLVMAGIERLEAERIVLQEIIQA